MRRTIASSSCQFHGATLTVRRMENGKQRRQDAIAPKWNEVAITIKLKTKDDHRDIIRMRIADCSPINLDASLAMWASALEVELRKIGKRAKHDTDYLVEIPPDDPSGLNRRFREFAEAVAVCQHVCLS